jgi:carbonic anhydrase
MIRKFALAVLLCIPFAASAEGTAEVDHDAIIADLMAGNARYVRGDRGELPRLDEKRREALVAGQAPKAIVLSCADSRVPPEHIFRQGLGDIFVSRVAGNVAMTAEVASVEYAVEHLHAPVLVVMGHTSCGAVKAAVQVFEQGGHLTESLDALVEEILPAVEEAEKHGGDVVGHAIELNAFNAAAKLLKSEVIAEAVHLGHLRIVVAEYSLATGAVTVLDGDFRGASH